MRTLIVGTCLALTLALVATAPAEAATVSVTGTGPGKVRVTSRASTIGAKAPRGASACAAALTQHLARCRPD